MTDPKNVERFKQEITVTAPAIAWLTVLGNIHLALRHPENSGESARISRDFAAQLATNLIDDGFLTADFGDQGLRESMAEFLREFAQHGGEAFK